MKIQLSIIKDKITVHYVDEGSPHLKSNYADYKNLPEEDQNKIEEIVNYFKELKDHEPL